MNKKILLLATLTLFGFPLVGWSIAWLVGGPSLSEIFVLQQPLLLQLAVGIATGLFTGWLAWQLIRQPFMDPVRHKYGDTLGAFKLNRLQIVYISLCAGIGEEILFRGIIQPHIGIWLTSILFVAIHGYLNPMNGRLFIYGIYMTLIIVVIGYFAETIGLYSAMAAHTVIDIILLHHMTKPILHETIHLENSFQGEKGPE